MSHQNGLVESTTIYEKNINKIIGERLVLKSNSDIAFSEGAEKMLKDKELKSKKQEIDKIEAEWSKAQKDVMRCKLASAAPESDLLAKEQSKNKVLSLCLENGRRLGFNSPVSSQEDVNMMYNKVKKLSEQDQLSIMRQEIKFKKILFSELPPDYPLSSSTTSLQDLCSKTCWLCML